MMFNLEKWYINTAGLHRGKKLWCGRGWFTIMWVTDTYVIVHPDKNKGLGS
jgi:hypothetical protein